MPRTLTLLETSQTVDQSSFNVEGSGITLEGGLTGTAPGDSAAFKVYGRLSPKLSWKLLWDVTLTGGGDREEVILDEKWILRIHVTAITGTLVVSAGY